MKAVKHEIRAQNHTSRTALVQALTDEGYCVKVKQEGGGLRQKYWVVYWKEEEPKAEEITPQNYGICAICGVKYECDENGMSAQYHDCKNGIQPPNVPREYKLEESIGYLLSMMKQSLPCKQIETVFELWDKYRGRDGQDGWIKRPE